LKCGKNFSEPEENVNETTVEMRNAQEDKKNDSLISNRAE